MTSGEPNPFLRAVQRLVIRTAHGPVRQLWALAYRAVAAAAIRYLTHGERGAAGYLRSGLGAGDLMPGISDVDLAFILADDPGGPDVASARVRERYEKLVRRVPFAGRVVDVPGIYEQSLANDLAGASFATWGLDGRGAGDPIYPPSPARLNRCRLLERPGLYADYDDWLLHSGRDRRPVSPPRDEDERLLAAWMELSFWWRFAFESTQAPDRMFVPRVCVKLVAESARVRLWLDSGARLGDRREVLERFREAHPESARDIDEALSVLARIQRLPPPPLRTALRFLAEQTRAAAGTIANAAGERGFVSVALLGAEQPELLGSLAVTHPETTVHPLPPRAIPICDWRGLAAPDHVEDAFVVDAGAVDDPRALATASRSRSGGMYHALADGSFLVFPLPVTDPPKPRRLSCAATDPVTFALLDGCTSARFPLIRGWAAHDVARRAVAEQRARIELAGEGERALRMLVSAARPALLLESLEQGEPRLAVTLAATLDQLRERSEGARAVCDETRASLTPQGLVGDVPATTVTALRALVEDLPAYRR